MRVSPYLCYPPVSLLIDGRNEGKRQVWLHEKNVQTSTLKKHLQKEHQQWEAKCSDLGIACSMSSFKDDLDSVQDQPFTMEGFLHYLARWIAVDDQVRISLACLALVDTFH